MVENLTEDGSSSRPLGPLEQYSAYRTWFKAVAPVMVGAEYSHPLEKNVLYPALTSLISDEALLGASIEIKPAPPSHRMVKIGSVDLDKVVTYKDSEKLDDLVNAYYSSNEISYNQLELPLWRVMVLNKTLLLFWFDHALLDGTSGALFHQLLLAKLNQTNGTGEFHSTVPVSKSPLDKTFDNLAKLRPPPNKLAKLLFKELIWNNVKPKRKYAWDGFEPKYPVASITAFGSLSIEQSAKLLAIARNNNTTINGIMVALMLEAAADCVPEKFVKKSTGETEITFSIAINNRGKPPMDPKYRDLKFGNFVTACDGKVKIKSHNKLPKLTLDMARYTNQQVSKSIDEKRGAYVIGLLGYVDLKDYFKSLKDKLTPRREIVEFSNLGAYSAGEGNWTLERMVFSQVVSSTNSSYTMSVCGVKGKTIGYSISIGTNDQAELKHIMNIYESRLQEILNLE